MSYLHIVAARRARTCLLFFCVLFIPAYSYKRPHILLLLVDDMGWNDVSYHGSNQILTPNIDALASQGVILQNYYSEAICTPARTALLTGKYPMRLGMQGDPIRSSEDRGIPLTEKLLPEYLQKLGYSTHLVGKWHLGMSRREYLPQARGYMTHLGVRGGFCDSYTYGKIDVWPDGRELYGLDFFDGDIPVDGESRYVTDLLTDRAVNIIKQHNETKPLFLHLAHTAPHAGNAGGLVQPPLTNSVENKHIPHPNRRLYADVVSYLDKSIGKVITALANKGILEDTIIVFASDNGAPTTGSHNNFGVNLPFRGIKHTPWEGAVRVPAFVWHSSLNHRIWGGLMHISDWMPTLIAAAGGEIVAKIDGVNQWQAIRKNQESQRQDVLIAIEDNDKNMYAAYRLGDYKIIMGNLSGLNNDYYGTELMTIKGPSPNYFSALRSSEVAQVFEAFGVSLNYKELLAIRSASIVQQNNTITDRVPCIPTLDRGCLFNVRHDPAESRDLWSKEPNIAALLSKKLRALWVTQLKKGPIIYDENANPANFGYVWTPWINKTAPSYFTSSDLEKKRKMNVKLFRGK